MKLLRLLVSEYILVLLIIFFSVFISLIPTFYHLLHTPKGSQFSFAYNFVPDYYQFISWMRDGRNGEFALTSRFTPEIFPRIYGHTFFPFLGFMTSLVGINLPLGFTLARVFLGIGRLMAIYILIGYIFKNKYFRIGSLVLIIFLPSFLTPQLTLFMPGITNFDVFKRVTFLPHHLLSNIFMILFFPLFVKSLEEDKKRYSLISGFFLLLSSFANPAILLNMGVVLFTYSIFNLVFLRHKLGKLIKHILIVGIFLIISFLYYKYYLFSVFPWNKFITGESIENRSWSIFEYIGVLGLALPFTFPFFLKKEWRKNTLLLLMISWALGPLIAFVIVSYMSHPYLFMFRFFQSQQSIPFGILATLGIISLYERFKSRLVILLSLIIIIFFSFPYYFVSLKAQIDEVSTANYFTYIPLSTIASFDFLDKNTKRESVVFAGYFMGQVIPAYTHNRVYIGHADATYDYANKLKDLTAFFSNNIQPGEALRLLKEGRVTYIFFGPDTPPPTQTVVPELSNVKLLYENSGNYIYQVY